jgi:primase-polymerase (primpol)-like protein
MSSLTIRWKFEKRANTRGVVRDTKVPYNSASGRHAESNNPATWSSFDASKSAYERGGYDGVGFCLSAPYVGVDLDGCRPDGKTDEPWAEEIIRELGSYTEVSPSGRGVRIIVRGELPPGGRQKEFKEREHYGIGLYDALRGRYLTITGFSINGNAIQERTAELHRIHARLFAPKTKVRAKSNTYAGDSELIERAKKAKDGGKFARLWDGDWEGDYASQSEAELALCMKLAFWTGRDAGRIDALFRQSGLMREKWDREDYRSRTLEEALRRQTETVHASTWLQEKTVAMASSAVDDSIEALNAMMLFNGRLKFASVSRRGSMIMARTVEGQQIIWPTMKDLTGFASARACIAEGADVLLPHPPRNQMSKVWDPIAEKIIRLAARDALAAALPM